MPVLKMKFRYALNHNLHVFLQDHESDVQLLPSPLYVDLLMDLLCVSEADSTFNGNYVGFISKSTYKGDGKSCTSDS
jgi:hypothetical protein